MARLEGIIKFSGALGELVAYQRKGKWVVRRKTSLDKKRVKTDPAFKNSRKASQEFGGAATIGKYLRNKWHPILIQDKDTTLYHRLSSRIYQWIKAGQGEPGARSFTWSNLANDFEPISLNQANAPDYFLERLPVPTRTANTLDYTLETHCRNAPLSATHCKVGLHMLALPEFAWNGTKYQPIGNTLPLINLSAGIVSLETPLNMQGTVNLPYSASYAFALSITFYQQTNNQFYPLSDHPLSWQAIL